MPSNVLYNSVAQPGQFAPQPVVDNAEQLTVDVSGPTNQVTLKWPALNLNYPAVKYILSVWNFEPQLGYGYWLPIHEQTVTTNQFPRNHVFTHAHTTGAGKLLVGLEYRLEARALFNVGDETDYVVRGLGYVVAKQDGHLVDDHGKVLLVVDNRFQSLLASELDQFKQDLVGDGWNVLAPEWVSATQSPASVKAQIAARYASAGSDVRSVVLIGAVPIPRSGGNENQGDGHTDHNGAWAADSYYGDMTVYPEGQGWTDSSANILSPPLRDPENVNIPGDGKFDNFRIPSDIEMSVGRIDFSLMNSFFPQGMTATDAEAFLLSRYFLKNHQYRLKFFDVLREARIDSNGFPGEDYWASMASTFGAENVVHKQWSLAVYSEDVISWMYAGGSGNNDLVAGSTQTSELLSASNPINAVFHHFRGSWSGDWGKPPRPGSGYLDSLLNAVLADSGKALVSVWSGLETRSTGWETHRMATGGTFGQSLLDSMNFANKYYKFSEEVPTPSYVSRSMLGDPTLRLHIVAPVSDVSVVREQFGQSGVITTINNLSWTPSPDTGIVGYHVYRAAAPDGPLTRLTSSPVTQTLYNDTTTIEDAVYMIRAVKLEDTPSGTYYNASTGILAVEYGGGIEWLMAGGGGAGANMSQMISPASVSIFDDLFDSEDDDLLASVNQAIESSASTPPASAPAPTGTVNGPVLVFGFAPAAAPGGIAVHLPHVAGVPGRRVELFDASTNQLLGRRDLLNVGQDGAQVTIANVPTNAALKVRVSGLGGSGPISAGAVAVSSS